MSTDVLTRNCLPPRHERIEGRYVQLIPTDPSDADELYRVIGGSEHVGLFDYMPYGPFNEADELRDRVTAFSKSSDPLFWTIRHLNTGRFVGWLSLLRIDTANRVVEIGHIMYAPELQRTTAATEAWYLLARKAVSLPCPTMRV